MPEKQPIPYAPVEVNGLTAWPETRALVQKAIEGHPIDVMSADDYINLYHVFERLVRRTPRLRRYRIVRRQVNHSRWRVLIQPAHREAPEYEPEGDYNPKRGRYKRLARQLHAGETVILENRGEAVKAQRAWHLYVPNCKRAGLTSSIEQIGSGPRHRVWVHRRSRTQ